MNDNTTNRPYRGDNATNDQLLRIRIAARNIELIAEQAQLTGLTPMKREALADAINDAINTLTHPEQPEKYMGNRGDICPVCDSDNITLRFDAKHEHPTKKRHLRDMRCCECSATWTEVYGLAGCVDIKE